MKTFISACLITFLLAYNAALAVNPDSIYMANIHTVRLFQPGNQLSFPLLNLNGKDRLELHFDDLDGNVKNYYYTYELCNYDWSPSNTMSMDYIKGFSQNRILDYRFSSVALTRYTHYRVLLPENNSYPTKSGNYILRVYLDGDISKVAFTRRLLVVDSKAAILGKVTQPFTPKYFNTGQKVSFNIDLKGVNDYNAPQQTHVVVLQNFRWDNAIMDMKPAFIRGNSVEYNSETQGIFPGGKEWRWLDLRDFHLQSDRVQSADYNKTNTVIYLKPDLPWDGQRYVYFNDLDGMSTIEAVRGIDPNYEGDYATVYFSYLPPNGNEYTNEDLYLFGQLTDYQLTDSVRLQFNPSTRLYETHLLLKQGYYDYTYLLRNKANPADIRTTDGNYYETENTYTILVYYKPFGARADQLIGVALFNSRSDRPGMSF